MDQIADMLVRIQNGIGAQKEALDLPHSSMKEAIARILQSEGYIAGFEVMTKMNKKHLRLALKYIGKKKNIIAGLRRVSKPGRRIYVGAERIPTVQSGFGTVIISTSKGLMTGEDAGAQKLGGEVVCYIW